MEPVTDTLKNVAGQALNKGGNIFSTILGLPGAVIGGVVNSIGLGAMLTAGIVALKSFTPSL